MRISSLLLVLCVAYCPAHSAQKGKSFFAIDLGVHALHLSKKISASSGQKSKVGSMGGFFRARPGFHLGKAFYFEPSFGLVLPWKSGLDGSVKSFVFQGGLDLGIPLFSFLKFRLGPGLLGIWNASKGKTVKLSNGTGTSDFFNPNLTVIQFLYTVDGGLGVRFSNHISLHLDAYVMNIANRSKRSFNGAATVGIIL